MRKSWMQIASLTLNVVLLVSVISLGGKLEDTRRTLRSYIENGGTVLSEHSFGLFNETFKMSYQVPGYGFAEIFGAADAALLTQGKNITKYALRGCRCLTPLGLRREESKC